MAKKMSSLVGEVFGRFTVISFAGVRDNGVSRWLCRCSCGSEVVHSRGNLKSGAATSCGCASKMRESHVKHGMFGTPTYTCWAMMKQRCCNPNAARYDDYGGRGISVCERWESFENFLADMGEKPDGRTIERRDVNGNYEPSNCVWETPKAQARNRRNNRVVEFNGVSKCISEWSEELGIPYQRLYHRLVHAKWPVERALVK